MNGRYDELVIRTFEPSSIFATLPPGISISQVIDKTQCCHLREAHACIVPSQRTPDASIAHAGLKEQYTNATPTANFPNGHGMNSAKSVPSHGQSSSTPSGSRPAYRPPHKPRQSRGSPNIHPEGDVEMQPAQTNDSKHLKPPETHLQSDTGEHCEDVPMECVATALDPVDNNTHSSDKDSQEDNDTTHGRNPLAADNNLAMANLGQNQSSEPGQHAHDGLTNNPSSPKAKHLHHNANTPTDHNDVANVGYPRLCDTSQSTAQTNLVPKATVQPLQLDCPTQRNDSLHSPTHTHATPQDTRLANLPTCIADDSTPKQQDHSGNFSLKAGLPTPKSRQTSRQTNRSHDEHRNGPNQPLETVLDLLTHNAAYQQLDSNANELAHGDEVIFVKASHSPIDNILCGSEQSSSFLISNREIFPCGLRLFCQACNVLSN